MKPQIAKLFVDAVCEFMQTMVGLECTVQPVANPEPSRAQVSGVVTLSGTSSGQVAVAFSRDLGKRLVARVMGKDVGEIDEAALHDGVGEVANIIAGNAKSKLSQLGFELRISLPSTVTADPSSPSCDSDWTAHYDVQSSLGCYTLSVLLSSQ
jgi:chemotaxis protein CheX